MSHEEILGYEAYRRNVREYNAKLAEVLALRESGDETAARRVIAAQIFGHSERYEMVDDDFQLSVLTARYLGRATPAAAPRWTSTWSGCPRRSGPRGPSCV